jgi:hypothetical protein
MTERKRIIRAAGRLHGLPVQPVVTICVQRSTIDAIANHHGRALSGTPHPLLTALQATAN